MFSLKVTKRNKFRRSSLTFALVLESFRGKKEILAQIHFQVSILHNKPCQNLVA